MNSFSDEYLAAIDAAAAEKDYFRPVLEAALTRTVTPAAVLDVGCGTGVFGAQVKRLTSCHLTGVDGSEYAIAAARKNGYDRTILVSDIDRQNLPFDAGAFDFCLCKDVLEHLLAPDFALREMARVLIPQGHALIHVPNHFTLYGRLKLLTANSLDAYGYFPDARRWNFPHIRFFSRTSLEDMARECGFELVADFCSFFPAVPLGRLWLPVTAWRQALAAKRPDLFAEGYALLLRKVVPK